MDSILTYRKEVIPLIFISVLGIILTILLNYLAAIPILFLTIYLVPKENKKKTLLWIVIVTLFIFVGELNPELRLIIQIADISILGYLFLLKFGLNISTYPKLPKIFVPFLFLYYISMILSTLMSDHPYAGILMILRQTVFFMITYFLYALIEDESDVKNYFYALIFAAFVMASSTLYLFIFDSTSFLNFESGSRGRITGLISNPNNIANFYLVSFPLLLISILKKKSFISSKLSWILVVYFSFALFLTISRSAILGIIISSIIILYLLKRKYFYYILYTTLIAFIVILFSDTIYNYISLLFRIERGITGRDYLWELSINIIKDNPIFGLGPGAYKYEMFNYFPVHMGSWIGQMFKNTYVMTNGANLSHSYFLFLFSEIGVLGIIVAVYLLIIFLTFFRLLKNIEDKTSNYYYLIVALLAIGVSEFARGIVESIGILYFGVISADLPFWLMFISLSFYSESMFNKSKAWTN